MSFRRIPFQFSTTDPIERQLELEKRFGFQPTKNMYVNVSSPVSMMTGNKDSVCSSPRLQHRVPIFVEGQDHPINASVDSANAVSENKPNVRIVPIQLEEAKSQLSIKHETGQAKIENGKYVPCAKDLSPLTHSMQDLLKPLKVKAASGPRVHTVPVQIENRDTKSLTKPEKKVKSSKGDHPNVNGYTVSKPDQVKLLEKNEQSHNMSLKKIESILEELKSYQCDIELFNGSVKEKKYRYLDEMLTRCMLRLDDIDTLGNESVRLARKDAVKKVQSCIDLLESKVMNEGELEANATEKENHSLVTENNELVKDVVNTTRERAHESSEAAMVNSYENVQNEISEVLKESCDVEMAENGKTENSIKYSEEINKEQPARIKIDIDKTKITENKGIEGEVSEIEMADINAPENLQPGIKEMSKVENMEQYLGTSDESSEVMSEMIKVQDSTDGEVQKNINLLDSQEMKLTTPEVVEVHK